MLVPRELVRKVRMVHKCQTNIVILGLQACSGLA